MRAVIPELGGLPVVVSKFCCYLFGGELTTSFVLPAVYSNQFPEPLAVSGKTVDTAFADQFPSALPASAEAVHIVFPDGGSNGV
ncbi:hypothetical protein [Photorhabdus luminescens]|uniref:hypothetical protein n=1 Tax=Photorhabdus luminescens TaxID=29488 RepID=UPI00069FB772